MSHPILAIETSVATGSVALVTEGEVLCEKSFIAGRRPSATLWPALQEVMAGVEKKSAKLAAIVVGTGPGSYNGSRVGIAGAQGIALVKGASVAPLCSFEGVLPRTHPALAIGDARRGNFSLQRISQGRLIGDFELLSQEELSRALEKAFSEGLEVFSFDEASRFPIGAELQNQIVMRQSQAKILAEAFEKRSTEEQTALFAQIAEPFYLRDPHITKGKKKSPLAG